jgi:hypothetical protein
MNEALREEERRLRMLRFVVDLNLAILMQQTDLTLRESFDLLKNTRQAARNLFPGKDDVFELIYTPRFMRVIRERFVINGGLSGTGSPDPAPGASE